MNGKQKGFTLIELLVVVLIIGILAAIALPQYQKAVLKSRYTTLMPIAKGIAEGNEAYFMEHGVYAEDPTELVIKGQENYPDGTTLDLQDTDEYTYVLASRADLPGLHHIIYQHHSKNFPSETHCEAAKDNKLANWVCKEGLKGTKLPGSLNSGYYSYVLEGAGSGTTATAAAVLAEKACPENTDEAHCQTTTNADGSTTKKECTDPADTTTCTWTTIDEEGTTKTVCNGEHATYTNENFCVVTDEGSWDDPYEIIYDEDGEIIEKKICSEFSSGEGCKDGSKIIYNDDESYKVKSLWCSDGYIASNYQCSNGTNDVQDDLYDVNNNLISRRSCLSDTGSQCISYDWGKDYTYNANKKQIAERVCATGAIPQEGKCTTYSGGTDDIYDEQTGFRLSSKTCATGTVPQEGKCTVFESAITWGFFTENEKQYYGGPVRIECSGSVNESGECIGGNWRQQNPYSDEWINCTEPVNWDTGKCVP